VEAGCYYGKAINKKYVGKVMAGTCAKSSPSGPQPTTGCVDHHCENNPFTVRFWDRLEAQQKYETIYEGVWSCRSAAGAPIDLNEFREWSLRI
jgi:hypothetical protein